MKRILFILLLLPLFGEAQVTLIRQAQIQGLVDSLNNIRTTVTGKGTVQSVGVTDGTEIDFTVTNPTTTPSITGSILNGSIVVGKINATGTPSNTTFLRGDGTWTTPSGSGDVTGGASSTDRAIAIYNGTTGKTIQNSNITHPSTGGLDFTGQATPAYNQGLLAYDTDNQCLDFHNNEADITLNIGQESWIRVVNNSGSTITNGKAVYINGTDVSTQLPTIALAQANSATTTVCAGLATHDIENNTIGYVTSIGAVRGLNTAAFSNGATLFLSASSAGDMVTTAPTAPNFRFRIGICTRANASMGSVHVTPSTGALGNGTANQVFGMNNAGTAQEVKSIVAGTGISVNHSANTITIASSGGGTSNFGSKRTGYMSVNTSALTVAGITGMGLYGGGSSLGGTIATTATPANANLITKTLRATCTSASGAGSASGVVPSTNNLYLYRGNTVYGGGFTSIFVFGLSTLPSTARFFVGLYANNAAPANADPSSFTNMIGLGKDVGDANMQVMSNDNTGTANKSTTSTAVDGLGVYVMTITCPPNSSSCTLNLDKYLSGSLTNIVNNATVNTDMPVATTAMTPYLWVNNGATTGSVVGDFISVYSECTSPF